MEELSPEKVYARGPYGLVSPVSRDGMAGATQEQHPRVADRRNGGRLREADAGAVAPS
jgi:hypothetical protein